MSNLEWEDTGRTLLQKELRRMCEEVVCNAFLKPANRLDRGEELRVEDIYRMRSTIDELQEVTELAAGATQGVMPLSDVWDVLDDEAQSRYIQHVQENHLKGRDQQQEQSG